MAPYLSSYHGALVVRCIQRCTHPESTKLSLNLAHIMSDDKWARLILNNSFPEETDAAAADQMALLILIACFLSFHIYSAPLQLQLPPQPILYFDMFAGVATNVGRTYLFPH